MTYDQVVSRFYGARIVGDGKVAAPCPAHEDHDPSLSISAGTDGRTLVTCHAGCKREDVVAAVGLTMRDLFADESPAKAEPHGHRPHYDYKYEDKSVGFRSVRIPCPPPKNKTFRQCRPDGKGRWIWNLKGTRLVLYCLPELLAADPSLTVYVCEGEKDADRLRSMGLVSTTNPMGAGKWRPEYAEALRGRHVVVLVDNDKPGKDHGEQVAQSLRGIAAVVKVVLLPGLPPKGDVSDWLAAGHTADELHVLVTAAPEWTAAARPATKASSAVVTADDPSIATDGTTRSYDGVLEDALATQRFADLIRGRALYAAKQGVWWRYDGARWVQDFGEAWLLGEAIEVAKAYLRDALNDPLGQQYKARLAIAKRYNTVAGRRKLIEGCTASNLELGIDTAQFDIDPYLLNCANGTLNLRTGQLQKHSPHNKITKLAPVNYNPSAKSPLWDRFLVEVLPDRETIDFVQMFVGFCLTGSTANHIVVFLYGGGHNGKSVLHSTISELMGDYGVAMPAEVLLADEHHGHSCELMPLRGARWAVFPDFPEGRFDEARIKSFASADKLTARNLFERPTEWSPTHKMILAGNNKPIVRGQDLGIWRRLKLIPFPHKFEKADCDLHLPEKLKADLPAVLNWALAGCAAWQANPYALVEACATVAEATAEYRDEMDVIGPYLTAQCVMAPSAVAPCPALYRDYVDWAESQKSHPISDKTFGSLMRGKGFVSGQVRFAGKAGVRVWRGVGLRGAAVAGVAASEPISGNLLREKNLLGTLGETASKGATPATPPSDAPDPNAQLAHCLRVRPETTVSDADRQTLAEHFAGLNGTAEAAGQRLWNYWRAAPTPTVTDFLAKEPKRKDGAA